ncbi:class I SAM-dependent DNA methyltransferase [Aquidulcibacter sp.]|uniref:class I SAM-dependent DNA methyltransferase n=1 Tax=Aquidulcibacter sp. TaxID=2052990 RepID=UPI003BA42FAC
MDLDYFLDRWSGREGGAERANYQAFLSELTEVLGVARPDPSAATTELNDYVFERAVRPVGQPNAQPKRIDLYKRDHFILEAKQSRWRVDNAKYVPNYEQLTLPSLEATTAITRKPAWDALMRNAFTQACDYVAMLPPDHKAPPFLIVADVGRCLDVYADWTGTGRGYSSFPDRLNNRILLDDLRDEAVRKRLAAIWIDPHSLNPATRAAVATREIAVRLAEVSKSLEAKSYAPEDVALFLMRCIFTMFAEDVGLLPPKSFTDLLTRSLEKPDRFARNLKDLWQAMDKGGDSLAIDAKVRHFNGGLFASTTVFDLERAEIGELLAAASKNWREVEPAIFGTLLEQALDPKERARLGAHFTPRPYVERLVEATILGTLKEDWDHVLRKAEHAKSEGDGERAISLVKAFHHELCSLHVLDPACGTGNFLYVALDLMKRLEGEVLNAMEALGGQEGLAFLKGEGVTPDQFLGLEVNPRAASIAELVLWLGHLQQHYRNREGHPAEPILQAFGNITKMDAVLRWDGYPVPQVISGAEAYPNPRQPAWPEAEFIIGNPPFIGGKDIRANLGGPYTEALWKAHPAMNDSADLVMYWWDRAAQILTAKNSRLRRFGFVTTNSITQVFQRRVVERHLSGKSPLSILFAIADHPWTKATKDAASVRIAMTVAQAGTHEGKVLKVLHEAGLETDTPQIQVVEKFGRVNPDLTIGVDLSKALALRANEGLASRGVALHGSGFIVTPKEAQFLGLGARSGLETHIRPYRNGKDIMGRSRNLMVIDLFGLEESEVRQQFPEVYQHMLLQIKPDRDNNNRASYRDNWWIHGEPRKDLRPALEGLPRYIVTVETSKHRVFQFLDASILPDNKLIAVGSDAPDVLGILSSRAHYLWYIANSGMLGVYDREAVYVKSRCFDPFPFPDATDAQKAMIGAIAEELDATRKLVLAENPDLTLTGLYNLLEKIHALAPEEEDQARRARVYILQHLHQRLDAAVAEAYGWPADLGEQEILGRLVALNQARRAEEAKGKVRWLRPDFQISRFGRAGDTRTTGELDLGLPSLPAGTSLPIWPKDRDSQPFEVESAVRDLGEDVTASQLARVFKGGGKRIEPRVSQILLTLATYGRIQRTSDGRYRA